MRDEAAVPQTHVLTPRAVLKNHAVLAYLTDVLDNIQVHEINRLNQLMAFREGQSKLLSCGINRALTLHRYGPKQTFVARTAAIDVNRVLLTRIVLHHVVDGIHEIAEFVFHRKQLHHLFLLSFVAI